MPSALPHEPAPEPVVITPAPVRSLQWDSTDEIFAYREKDTVLLRSSHAPYHHFGSVEMPGVLDFSLYHESDSGVQLIAGAADGTVAVWTVPTENTPPPYTSDPFKDSAGKAPSLRPDAPHGRVAGLNKFYPDFISDATNGRAIDVLVFSEDSNYLAEHFSDTGELGLHFRLRYTSELVSRQVLEEVAPVYSMAFSHDKELLAAAATDGTVKMWSSFNGRLMYEHQQYPESRVSIHFIEGTYNLLVSASPVRLVVKDPTGNELVEIEARSPVVEAKVLSGKGWVAALTEENRLEIYRLEDGVYLGYIPSFNETAITSFDFNSDSSRLLAGHEDGSVYMLDVETVMLPPRSAPILRLIAPGEVVEKGEEFTESIPLAEYADTEAGAGPALAGPTGSRHKLFADPRHSVDLLVGTTFLPDPFTMSVDTQISYSNGFLLHPFSMGLQWRSSWGFPQRNFPYIYHLGEVRHHSPLLVSWVVEVPFGLTFSPWDFGLEIHTEVAVGFAMHELWNRRLGGEAVTAGLNSRHFHGAVVTALTLGVGWKGAMLKVSGEWDSEFGWTGQFAAGYSFRLPLPRKYRESAVAEGSAAPAVDAETGEDVEAAVESEAPAVDAETDVDADAEAEGMRAGTEGVLDYEKESVLD